MVKEKESYINFQKRVESQYSILNRLKVKYGIESSPVKILITNKSDSTYASIQSKIKNLKFYYHFGNELERK